MSASSLARRSAFQRVIDSNPFYLISACCMLAGCLALTNSLSWVSISRFNLLILIGTLNLYEAALIALAAFLVLRRGLRHDGMMLVILEAFFLIDVTFLNAEIATQRLSYGPVITALCFVAAIVKLAVLTRIMGVRQWSPESVFILIQVAAILALPVIFSRNAGGIVTPREFYLVWWIVGLMPVIYELPVRWLPRQDALAVRSPALTAYMILAWTALVAHVGVLHYVYDVPFYGAMGAPLLLAISIALEHAGANSVASRMNAVTLQILLPIAALFVSVSCPDQLTITLGHSGHFTFTTLLLATAASYLLYTYLFLRRIWVLSVLLGVGSYLTYTFGPTLDQLNKSTESFWSRLSQWVWTVIPQTAAGWGMFFVAAAFVFLGIGAGVSLRRTDPPPPDVPIGEA